MKRISGGTRGFGSINTGRDKVPRVDDLVMMWKPNAEFQEIRLIGDVMPYAQHWIKIQSSTGELNIPKTVPNFDPLTDSYDETIKDPYKDLPNRESTQKRYYVNAIIRSIQESEPRKKEKPSKTERKSGFMDSPSSKSWTPVRVLSVPTGVAKQLQKLITMNKHKVKGKTVQCELSDPKYGCDIFISFDPSSSGPQKYSVQKGDHTPLTDKEKEYLLWDLDFTETAMKAESEEVAEKEAKALLAKAGDLEDFDEDDEDDIDLSSKKSKSKKSKKSKDKKKSKSKNKDEDKPKKKRKKKRI